MHANVWHFLLQWIKLDVEFRESAEDFIPILKKFKKRFKGPFYIIFAKKNLTLPVFRVVEFSSICKWSRKYMTQWTNSEPILTKTTNRYEGRQAGSRHLKIHHKSNNHFSVLHVTYLIFPFFGKNSNKRFESKQG